jgi:hypothetical protein
LDYELESEHHKKGEANFMLAELKLQQSGDCQIIAVVDDTVPLSGCSRRNRPQRPLPNRRQIALCNSQSLLGDSKLVFGLVRQFA